MFTRLFLGVLPVSVAIACSSGPKDYLADALIPAPARATDSLRNLVFTRVRGMGFTVYEAQDAVARYAERDGGCGFNCKKADVLLVSFAGDPAASGQRIKVTALTCKRGWVAPWKLVHPSEAIRLAA